MIMIDESRLMYALDHRNMSRGVESQGRYIQVSCSHERSCVVLSSVYWYP